MIATQNRHQRIIPAMKSFLLLTFIFVLGIFANGQEKKEVPVLKLSLLVKENKLCFGNAAEITAKMTNVGEEPLAINSRQIGVMKSFTRITRKSWASFSIHKVGSTEMPNLIILQPSESFTKNLDFVFNDSFFKKAGRIYSMKIGYEQPNESRFKNIDVWQGSIISNEIDIFIKKCD